MPLKMDTLKKVRVSLKSILQNQPPFEFWLLPLLECNSQRYAKLKVAPKATQVTPILVLNNSLFKRFNPLIRYKLKSDQFFRLPQNGTCPARYSLLIGYTYHAVYQK